MESTTIVKESLHRVHLHFDILVYVGHWITKRRDLLSFISTCSDLYRAGVSILLGFKYRITKKNLAAFHNFLVSKSPSSFLGLRSLCLHFPAYSMGIGATAHPNDSEVTMITNILKRATKIRDIEIFGSIMNLDPAVYRALAALPALETLNLGMCRDSRVEILAVIRQLRSPLVSLDCMLHGENEDTVTALSNFCHTLERLVLSESVLYKAAPTDLCYPKITHLELVSVANMQLHILIPALPNLKELVVKYADDFPNEADALRADNLQFQQDHPDQIWRLSSLVGDVASLHVLALQTAVYQVSIICLEDDDNIITAGSLEAILTPLHPLSSSMDRLEYAVFKMDWLSAAVAQCCELGRLNLELTFVDTKPIHENRMQLDVLFEQLASVSASKPALVLLCINLSVQSSVALGALNEHPSATFAEDLDSRVLATRAILAVPTLKMSRFIIWPLDLRTAESYFYWTYQDDGEPTAVPDDSHAETNLDEKTKSLIEAHDRLLMESGHAD